MNITNIIPMQNTSKTFLTRSFPGAAISILSEKAAIMAEIISKIHGNIFTHRLLFFIGHNKSFLINGQKEPVKSFQYPLQ